jgi:mRNA-degrading endonuclease toxin of MazEF toxin-antitoxin module
LSEPARGDIYHIEIADGEAMGHELKGGHWWVVLSITQLNAALKLFTAVPLTSVLNSVDGKPKDRDDFRLFRIRIPEKYKTSDPGRVDKVFEGESIALVEQTRVFSCLRIKGKRCGRVTDTALAGIEAGLLFLIGAGIHRQQADHPTAAARPAKSVVPAEPPKPLPGKPLNLQGK